jgi:ABC-type polysaccharide/polyol phosphate transport system ATPase subunit
MARIEVANATIDYPIFNSASMHFRNRLVEIGTGGIISRGTRNVITVRALDDVSFTIEDGEFVGLVGHNGAGKSTLLRTLAGVYTPVSGSVEVTGTVSTIFQLGAGMNRDLSGYENIVRMGMYMGASAAQARAFIPDVEEFSELGNFLSMPVHTYSDGMLTRLSFAVATAVRPDILLIDEALSAGDAEFQKKAQARISDIISSAKILVLASHVQNLIELYCNRVLHFEHGKLIKDERLKSA